jgi:hypothetical protein
LNYYNMELIVLLSNSYIVIYFLFMIKHGHLLKLNLWYELLCTFQLIALIYWCHELSLEIWICLFDYDMNLWYSSQNTYDNMVVLVFMDILFETLVGRGSHQSVWTDHPTVRSLILIAFWFFDELYLMIFLLRVYLRNFSIRT